MEEWNATRVENLCTVNESALYSTFLEGSRFWIQRILLPLVVSIGIGGNGNFQLKEIYLTLSKIQIKVKL